MKEEKTPSKEFSRTLKKLVDELIYEVDATIDSMLFTFEEHGIRVSTAELRKIVIDDLSGKKWKIKSQCFIDEVTSTLHSTKGRNRSNLIWKNAATKR